MSLSSAIIQSLAESEGRETGQGSLFSRFTMGDNPEMLAAYNQGISNGIARRIADAVEAAGRRNNSDY